jgi:hypothetical protein
MVTDDGGELAFRMSGFRCCRPAISQLHGCFAEDEHLLTRLFQYCFGQRATCQGIALGTFSVSAKPV